MKHTKKIQEHEQKELDKSESGEIIINERGEEEDIEHMRRRFIRELAERKYIVEEGE